MEHRFAMVSEWMDHGNINEFIQVNVEVNRAQLVSYPVFSRNVWVTGFESWLMLHTDWSICTGTVSSMEILRGFVNLVTTSSDRPLT